MSGMKNIWFGLLTSVFVATAAIAPVAAQDQEKPNIVVIMADDVGIWNIGAYHRGMMAGRTPNLDKIAAEGMLFTDYYAEASCTAGRAAFVMGQLPIRTGLTTVGQAGATVGMPAEAMTIATAAQEPGLRHRAVRQEPSRRPQRRACPPSTASTSSSATSITSTPWRTRRTPAIRRSCWTRSAPATWFTALRPKPTMQR